MSRRSEFSHRVTALSFIATCLWAMCLSPAVAAEFSLTKVADFNTAIPNGTGNFTNFFNSPLVSGDYVAFKGSGRFGQQGLYLFDGRALRRVADRSTPIPDGTGNFTEFYWLALSGTNVLFDASGSSGQRGLYLFDGGALLRVADTNTPIPDGTGTFSFTEGNAISGRSVAFFGGQRPSGQHGIYLFDGSTLSRIVDTTTPIPNGTGNFSNMESPLISGDHVAFVAGGGIYLFDGHTVRQVADQSTPIPNGTGNFTNSFYLPMISGGNILVSYIAPCVLPECDPDADRGHEWPPFRGTYLFNGSTLSRVADNLNTPIPNGTGNFTTIDGEVIDGSHVALSGAGSSGQVGIYLFDGSTLKVIADTSTRVPNRTGHFSWAGRPAISGNNVVFIGAKGPCGTPVFVPNCVYKVGIYLFDGSTLSRIADTKTAIPRGTGNFTDVGAPMISGRRVAFLGLGQPGQLGIYLATPSRHNLALVKITAPKLVTQGSGPQPVKVQIQNRGNHKEVITSANLGNGVTTGLARLDVSALGVDDDAEKCQPAVVSLDAARNAARFKGGSAILEPEATLAVHFLVTYRCLAAKFKPATDTTRGDYRHVASVFHAELGAPDRQPADDICPRDPLPGGVDASPAGSKDPGCGARKPASTLGDPVLTDVVPPTMR